MNYINKIQQAKEVGMTELIYENNEHVWTEIYENGVWSYTTESIREVILKLLNNVPEDIIENREDEFGDRFSGISFELEDRKYYIWWEE